MRDGLLSAPADIRTLRPEEVVPWLRAVMAGFGDHADPQDEELAPGRIDPDRAWAGLDDGVIVCTARDWDTDLALPGGARAPAAALTAVTVSPTHRRRGLLREMMRRHLDGARERGQALSVLIASEHSIYGRFGFGPATDWLAVEIGARAAAFRGPEPPPGRFRLIGADAAADLLPELRERVRRAGAGDIWRSPLWWSSHLRDVARLRGGAGPLFFVVHERDGGPWGYATYRIRPDWPGGAPAHELVVHDLMGVDDAARSALWRYLLGVDLVGRIRAVVPVDDPVRWLLSDPRQVRATGYGDGLWARLVDPGAALAARRYAAEGRLALDLADPFLPGNAGLWVLEAGPGGAECARGGGPPDLALDVRGLGAAYLGAITFSWLAASGRVRELTRGALARADAMFAAEPRPFCATRF